MGICGSKLATTSPPRDTNPAPDHPQKEDQEANGSSKALPSPFFPFYSPSPAHSLFKKSPSGNGSNAATPRRFFKRPFPPPSPAKHIRSVLARRHGSVKPNEASIPEGGGLSGGNGAGLDKRFGFCRQFENSYEIGEEVGRGHFGYTCSARFKKGDLKGHRVAVKVIPKAKV